MSKLEDYDIEKISKYWTSNPENSEDIYIKEGNKLFKKY
jgi:cytochrome c553